MSSRYSSKAINTYNAVCCPAVNQYWGLMTLKSMWCKGSSTADPHHLLLLHHSFSFRVSSAVESQRSQWSGFQSTLHHILVLTGDDLCLGCLVFNFFDDLSEQEFRNSLEIGSLGQVLETDSEKPDRQSLPLSCSCTSWSPYINPM